MTSAKVALINRVNQPYESDLAIQLTLIGNNDLLNLNTEAQMTGPNGPCGTAPCFTPQPGRVLLGLDAGPQRAP